MKNNKIKNTKVKCQDLFHVFIKLFMPTEISKVKKEKLFKATIIIQLKCKCIQLFLNTFV